MDEKIDQCEVAKYLGVTTRTVQNLIKRGELPPLIRLGRKQFWLKRAFAHWLECGGGCIDPAQAARESGRERACFADCAYRLMP